MDVINMSTQHQAESSWSLSTTTIMTSRLCLNYKLHIHISQLWNERLSQNSSDNCRRCVVFRVEIWKYKNNNITGEFASYRYRWTAFVLGWATVDRLVNNRQ